jgi:hypothetical protein
MATNDDVRVTELNKLSKVPNPVISLSLLGGKPYWEVVSLWGMQVLRQGSRACRGCRGGKNI